MSSMIHRVYQWNRRLDAWQRRGGTPRWAVYMGAVVYARLIPALAIWFGVLIVVNEVAADPRTVMAWVGAFAVLFWIANQVEETYSRIGGNEEA